MKPPFTDSMTVIISKVGLLFMLSIMGVLLFPPYKYEQFFKGRTTSHEYVSWRLAGKHDSMDNRHHVQMMEDYRQFKGVQWPLVAYNILFVGALSGSLFFFLLQTVCSPSRLAHLLTSIYLVMMLFIAAAFSFIGTVTLLECFGIRPFDNYTIPSIESEDGIHQHAVLYLYYALWLTVCVSSFLDGSRLFKCICSKDLMDAPSGGVYIAISIACVALLTAIHFSPLSDIVIYTGDNLHRGIVLYICLVFCIFRIATPLNEKRFCREGRDT